MRSIIAFGAIVILAACSERAASREAANSILDSILPGAIIGSLALPSAQRYGLTELGYVGYGDTSEVVHGVRSVYLFVDPPLVSDGQRPVPGSTIREVQIYFDTMASVVPVIELARARLGQPERFCAVHTFSGSREFYYWHSGGGLLITYASDSTGQPMLYTPSVLDDSIRAHPCAV